MNHVGHLEGWAEPLSVGSASQTLRGAEVRDLRCGLTDCRSIQARVLSDLSHKQWRLGRF